MAGFIGSAQHATLRNYLPYLNPKTFRSAFNDKLRRTRRAPERERLEKRRPIIEQHCQEFEKLILQDQLLPQDMFRSVHMAGNLCKTYATRSQVQMNGIRRGTAFWRIPGVQKEGTTVWDKFDQDLMRPTKPTYQMPRYRKREK